MRPEATKLPEKTSILMVVAQKKAKKTRKVWYMLPQIKWDYLIFAKDWCFIHFYARQFMGIYVI